MSGAATRWDGEDYDIENAKNWEPPTGGTFQTGTFTPKLVTTSADGRIGGWLLEDTDQARNLAAALYQAAEELDCCPEVDDADRRRPCDGPDRPHRGRPDLHGARGRRRRGELHRRAGSDAQRSLTEF